MSDIETWQPRAEVALNTAQDAAVQRLGEWAQSAQAAYQVAENLVRTSFVPEGFRGKPHEATAAILSGLEVGLSPMAALRSFDVIQGTAAPRAITLRAIVQSKGHDVVLVESNATRCVMEGTRKGTSKPQRVVWTLDRAKQLGLTGKANWKNQPQAMLLARATSEICRLIAADAILGIAYTSEEIADGGNIESQVAEVTAQPSAPVGTRKMSRKRPEPVADDPALPVDHPAHPRADESSEEFPAEDEPAITPAQIKMMAASMNELGMTDRAMALGYVADVIGREVESRNDLTKVEASKVIDALQADIKATPEPTEPAPTLDDPTADPSWGEGK